MGGGAGLLGLANTLNVFMGGLGGGEEEVASNLGELGNLRVAWELHPYNARLFLVDTAHGAQLHAP